MRQSMKPLVKCSLLFLATLISACSSRPKSEACWVNAQGPYKACYNLAEDYDDQGNRKPGVKPDIIPIAGLGDLNGHLTFDPQAQRELKRFLDESRREYERLKAEVAACRR